MVTVLIPAHNEELVIDETIKSVKSQLKDDDSLLVVADNCSDNTARIARDLGAKVLIREDAVRRGKGYALDFGIKHITAIKDKPDVLIVIDADCIVEQGSLSKLVHDCMEKARPIQALYLMSSNSICYTTIDSLGIPQRQFWSYSIAYTPERPQNLGVRIQRFLFRIPLIVSEHH